MYCVYLCNFYNRSPAWANAHLERSLGSSRMRSPLARARAASHASCSTASCTPQKPSALLVVSKACHTGAERCRCTASVEDCHSRRPSFCPHCWVNSVSTSWSWWAFWQQEAHPPLTRALQRLEPLLALLGGVQQLCLAGLALLGILAQPATSCGAAKSQVTTIKSPQLRDVTGNTHPSEALHSVF